MDSKLDSIILLLLTRESNLLTPLLATPKTIPQGNIIPNLSTQIKKLRNEPKKSQDRKVLAPSTGVDPVSSGTDSISSGSSGSSR